MDKKGKVGDGDNSRGKGAVYIVGIGPGDIAHLTGRAKDTLNEAQCVVGYTRYVELITELTAGKTVFTNGMTQEVERCRKAIEWAREGKKVAVISSGDSGIYGMAGVVLQLAACDGAKPDDFDIEVVPGIPAFVSAAALLGAPLMHDFASISLSDLLTPWEKIEQRLEAAAKADFVIILYNPKSTKRVVGLTKAIEIVERYRKNDTPAGLVRNATRQGQDVTVTTLEGLKALCGRVDMLSIIIIGNSATFTAAGGIITPRGYKDI